MWQPSISSRLKKQYLHCSIRTIAIVAILLCIRDVFVWRLAVPSKKKRCGTLLQSVSAEVVAGSQDRFFPCSYLVDSDSPCSRHTVALYNARWPPVQLPQALVGYAHGWHRQGPEARLGKGGSEEKRAECKGHGNARKTDR